MTAADEKVVGWDAIGHLVDAVEASVASHGQLLCRVAKPPVGEQMQEVLVATMRGRGALTNVDPPAAIQVLMALVNALEPRLIGEHALAALEKAAQETAGEMTVSAAGTIHAVITQQLAAEPAGLLRRLLQLLAAAVDAGQNLRDLAFVWGPLLGVPSTSVTAMEALLTSERKLPAKHPGRLGVRRRAVTNLSIAANCGTLAEEEARFAEATGDEFDERFAATLALSVEGDLNAAAKAWCKINKQWPDKPCLYNVFIANLHNNIDTEKLLSIFATFGTISSAFISGDLGYVSYDSQEAATLAISLMNRRILVNKPLHVWAMGC